MREGLRLKEGRSRERGSLEAEGSNWSSSHAEEKHSHIQLCQTTRTSGKTFSISRLCLPEAVTVNSPIIVPSRLNFTHREQTPIAEHVPDTKHFKVVGRWQENQFLSYWLWWETSGPADLSWIPTGEREGPVCYAPPASFRLRGGEIVPKKST